MQLHEPSLTSKRATRSSIVETLTALAHEQEALIDILRAALAQAGVAATPALQPWMRGLSRQEAALLGALFGAYPRVLDRSSLLDALPSRDHVSDRQLQLVDVRINGLRKKFGRECIETIRGVGFRLGPAQYEQMNAVHVAGPAASAPAKAA